MRSLGIAYLLGATLAYAACSGIESDNKTATSRAALVGGSAEATLRLTDEWPTGYCAEVEIENHGSSEITSWSVSVDANSGTIRDVWKGRASQAGTVTTVTPFPYNTLIPGGAVTEFGFCGAKSGNEPLPTLTSISVQGGDPGAGGASGTAGASGAGTAGGAGVGTAGVAGVGTAGVAGVGTAGVAGVGTAGGAGVGTAGVAGVGTAGTAGVGQGGSGGGFSEPESPLLVELTVTTDWGAGYCAEVVLENTASSDVTAWEVELATPDARVNNVWNGVGQVGAESVNVASLGYNALIPPGGTTSFGYCAVTTGPDHEPAIIGVVAQGGDDPVGTGGSPGAGGTPSSGGTTSAGGSPGTGGTGGGSSVTVALAMMSDWGSGYCSEVVLTNQGDAEIVDWSVDVDVPQATINNLWDGVTSDSSPGVVTIRAADYNESVLPGAAARFGFCAVTSGTAYQPSVVSYETE